MQHTVVGAHIDDRLPVLGIIQVSLKGFVAVYEMIIIRCLGNAHRGRVDDISQFPDRAVVKGSGPGVGAAHEIG
jgi:hypothetical protein